MNIRTKKRIDAKSTRRRVKNGLCALSGLVIAVGMSQPALAQVVPNSGDTVTATASAPLQQTSSNAITVPAGANGVTINNTAGGVISSTNATAIETSADTTINNAGTTSGGFNGVDFVNGAGSGSLTNTATGSITSDSRAVNIGGSVQLTNQGQILGTGDQRNGTVYSDSVANNFSIDNSGTIDAGAGNQGSGIGLEIGSTTTATVTNSGLIQGRTNTPGVAGNSGLSGDGLRLNNFGAPGVFDGSIDNTSTGEIRSESLSGTIAGLRVADGIGFQGQLDNAGEIEGAQNGLYFGEADHTGGVANNTGTISSGSRALNIDGTGLTVNNSGDILGTGNQRNGTVYSDGTADDFSFNNQNGGVVDAGAGNTGSGFAAEVGGAVDGTTTFSLTNDGTIAGRGSGAAASGAAGDGVRVGNAGDIGVADGSIVNNGTISSESTNGTTAGIRTVDGVGFQGTLDNAGTVSGAQNGLYFGEADHTGGLVNNSGTISSDSRAFNIDGTGLSLNNTGNILATGTQRNGTVYVDGTGDNFSIQNSGSIDASGGSGSGVSVQVGSFAGDIQTGSIQNSGLIAGSGTSPLDAGVRFFSGSTGSTFSGDIVNDFGGSIVADSAAAVLFDSNVSFDGTLQNDGAIFGSILLNDGDLDLGSTSDLFLEISSLTDFESIETTGSIFADGTLNIAFDDFVPLVGQQFDLLDFGFVSGSFDSINSGNILLDTSDLFLGGSVTVAAVGIPEPSTFTLLGLSGVLFAVRRRRTLS